MKKIILFIVFATIVNLTAIAQDYHQSLEGIEWVKIESKSSIIVKAYDKNELLIKAGNRGEINEKAKGLRLVGEDGTDNTNIGFYVIKEGNNLIVRNLKKNEHAIIYLPASQNISVKTTWHGDINIFNFTSEIEATAELNGSVAIKDVTGPITANSLNGEVQVSFSKVSQKSPITIYSTNGELEISLPKNTPADLSLYSTNGDIYTNFDISTPSKKGMRSVSSKKIKGTINKGGVNIKLNTTNGNIYLRKR